jgi:hypothetical protein
MEYIIYCDESVSVGKYFSDFYGGALIRSKDFMGVNDALNTKKDELNLHKEIKWTKVTSNYLDKYKAIISYFFEFIQKDIIKLRIMFRQNAQVPTNLTKDQLDKGFHLLYYQFIKHAFGLLYSDHKENVYLRLYFDKLPDSKLKNEQFLNYIYGLQSLTGFQKKDIKIRREDITEVNSHDHVILQCMDIVLGSIAFRLNDQHKQKPAGKRTIAKEQLYKHINEQIRTIYPNFNIGITTGKGEKETIWKLPYRHWKFTPKDFIIDETKYK